MLPFIATLVQSGLSLIANAALVKGKEFIEEKTGVKLDQPLTSEDKVKLAQFQYEHEEELLRLRLEENKLDIESKKIDAQIITNEADNVSDRWKADMASDSWLSKNIRPLALIFLLACFFIFAVASANNANVSPAYIDTLREWGGYLLLAYTGGRTAEKLMSMWGKK